MHSICDDAVGREDGTVGKSASRVEVIRVYEDPGRRRGEHRVLVDRLWPRGIRREALDYDEWRKDLAPSTELRRWYGHDPERFDEFADRYRLELQAPVAATALQELIEEARKRRLVLLTATRDVERSSANVVRLAIEGRR